jgi:hypothetical protein
LCSVVFEPESELERIEYDAFGGCIALESLCIPASLTVLSDSALSDMILLKSLTFESGSKLREIHNSVAWGCTSLKLISLPASLSVIDASAFIGSSIEEIVIDSANPNYFVSGQFLICVDGMMLIRCFGDGDDLGIDCLIDLGLRQIGRFAFSHCSKLKSICIPASIEMLCERCFSLCDSLSQVLFEPCSKLSQMGANVFFQCSSLTSMCIPANVESIQKQCFCLCTSLVEVSFEPGSKLSRIEEKAFGNCQSLVSFAIPAQLEIMACGVFSGCVSLCKLLFEIPSHLKELDLPPSEFGSLSIPDCVETVFGEIRKCDNRRRLLHFGRESCLMRIDLKPLDDFWSLNLNIDPRSLAFLDLPEEVLRRFRCELEGV